MAQPKEPNNGEREPKAPSESSETESSDIDTTGDEDGWDSGESTASLVPNHHSLKQASSHSKHSSCSAAICRTVVNQIDNVLRASKGKRSNAPPTQFTT